MRVKDTAEKINTILLCEEESHRSPRGTHHAQCLFGFCLAVFSFLPLLLSGRALSLWSQNTGCSTALQAHTKSVCSQEGAMTGPAEVMGGKRMQIVSS